VLILVVGLTSGRWLGRAQPPDRLIAGNPAASTGSPTTTPAAAKRGSPRASHAPTAATVRIPERGPRTYRLARTAARPLGKRGALITYNVRIESGLSYDPESTARFVHQVLNDRRSWGRSGHWRLQLVGPGTRADVRVYLVTPSTTNALCRPLQTEGRVSCFNDGQVVLNARRWAFGAASYGHDLPDYRRNVVNHEFGHALGFGHVSCPGKGRLAPIMMQQTKGLHGCRANPWPYPRA
jgi:hypothetical protein